MPINELALFEILSDLTENMETITREFESLREAVDSVPEARSRYQASPKAAGVSLSSIRALHLRIRARCQELRKE